MAYVMTEPCINVKDASCVAVCPVDCIYSTDDDAMYDINPDECIDCGACEPECHQPSNEAPLRFASSIS